VADIEHYSEAIGDSAQKKCPFWATKGSMRRAINASIPKNSARQGWPAGLWVTDERITHVNKRLDMPSSFALVFSQPGIT